MNTSQSLKLKERNQNFDWIKGIAIYLVVIGHVIQFNDARGAITCVYSWIYSFHMPVFFIISGYFAEKSLGHRTNISFIKQKVLTLLVPYVFWSLSQPLLFNNDKFNLNIFLTPDDKYWFVYQLFYLEIAHVTLIFLSRLNNKINWLLFSLTLFIILLVFARVLPCKLFVRGTHFAPFYLFGYALCHFNIFERYRNYSSKYDLSIVLVIFIISSVFYKLNTSYDDYNWILKSLKYPAGVSAIVILWKISDSINQSNRIYKYICYCGKNSIVIYLTHFCFIQLFFKSFILSNIITSTWIFILALTISIIIVTFCLFIGETITFFPFLNKVLYGKGRTKI